MVLSRPNIRYLPPYIPYLLKSKPLLIFTNPIARLLDTHTLHAVLLKLLSTYLPCLYWQHSEHLRDQTSDLQDRGDPYFSLNDLCSAVALSKLFLARDSFRCALASGSVGF